MTITPSRRAIASLHAVVVLVAIQSAHPNGLSAQQDTARTRPQPLPVVNVTGSVRGDATRVPGATTIVGPDVLRDRAPVSVMDALRTVPGVHTADEDPYGLNLNIGFRGLPPRRSARTLLLEDGVPILLGPYGDPSMHYAPPVEALERIEVVKGSGQVMNGPQTVGGVVNFVTRDPVARGVRGEVVAGGGAPGYRNAQMRYSAGRNGYGILADYALREGDGVRREQGHRFQNFMLKGLMPLGATQSLLIKGSAWNESSRIAETGLTQSEFEQDPYSLPFAASGRFDVQRHSALIVHDATFGRAQLRTHAFYSNARRASWRQSGESGERIDDDDYAADFNCAPNATSYDDCGNQGRPRRYSTMGLEPRLSLDFGNVRSGVTLDAGVRLYAEDARRRQFAGNAPMSRETDAELTRDNVIDTRAVAAFLQSRVRRGAFTLTPAMRVERVKQEVENRFPGREASVEQAYTQLLPGVGATWQSAPSVTVFAGVHRGFAPPRPADIYQPEPGQPIVVVDPETSWNSEIGIRATSVGGMQIEATAFRMQFGNEIIEAPAGAGQRFINGGQTLHQGFELGSHARIASLFASRHAVDLAATYTFLPVARFVGGDLRGSEFAGNRLPYAPRHMATASLTLAMNHGFSVGSSVSAIGRQFADEANTLEPSEDGQQGLLPSYAVTNVFSSYAIPATNLQLRASVTNLLDRVYITQRNEGIYTGMRRLVRAEIQWSF